MNLIAIAFAIAGAAGPGSLELIARGYPAGNGALVTLRLPGEIVSGSVVLDELKRETQP